MFLRVFFWGLMLSAGLIAQLDVTLSSKTLQLGQPLRLDIQSDSKITSSKVSFGGRYFDVFLYREEQGAYHYLSYLAVSRYETAKTMPLYVKVWLASKDYYADVYSIELSYPDIPKTGVVTLNKEKQKLSSNTEKLKSEGALLFKQFNRKSQQLYMKGPFQAPVDGVVTSGFGYVRSYNGDYRRSHAGIDYGNTVGTPIVAPNDGMVVLSDRLDVHGNTLMIDHGFGIITVYNHLNKRLVASGKRVKKGEVIGELGQTGVATGPHLHWGVSVQGVRVDPLFWLRDIHLIPQ